jgi:hypothetical protein
MQSTRVWGQCLIYRTTDSYDRGDTDDNLRSTDAPAHTQNGFKNLLLFFKNKLLPQSQCAFDWKAANFIWDEERRKVMWPTFIPHVNSSRLFLTSSK